MALNLPPVRAGNRTVTPAEIVAVARGATVELAEPTLERIEASKQQPAAAAAAAGAAEAAGPELEPARARAAAMGVLVFLLQGTCKAGRAAAEALCAALNDDALPALASGRAAAGVAAFLSAQGLLPAGAVAMLEGCVAEEAALLAFDAVGASNLIQFANLCTAVLADVTEAKLDGLDSGLYEGCRPHRGVMDCASDIRSFLANSERAGPNGGDVPEVGESAQMHGPALEQVRAALRTAQVEVNTWSQARSMSAAPVRAARAALESSLEFLGAASEARLARVGGSAPGAAPRAAPLLWLHERLSAEAAAGLAAFDALDGGVAAGGAEAEAAPAEVTLSESEEAWLAGLKEGKRNKERAKLLKKAAKKAAKAAKAGGGRAALKLGAGVRILRESGATDPWNPSGLWAQLAALLEQIAAGGAQRRVKVAKGARDFMPEQMRVREHVFGTIRHIFKIHGAVEIDTPVFELKDTLLGKYGEDGKLVYNLEDQGGELLSLRYDLTVPFARYLAMHNCGNIKRFHIARVYRRDNPQMNKGRFREFYQCDFDIAGTYAPMVADAEVITVAAEIIRALDVGDFVIKINHRRLLDAIMDICGVPADKFRPICSAIDKLDKEPWETVKHEMVAEKGISEASADQIGTFVRLAGQPRQLHAQLTAEARFGEHPVAAEAMADLATLFDYLDDMGTLDAVSFDLSLARGLTYYTGVIYEAVATSEGVRVGSIAGGGRYDDLVSMFSASGERIPCVGVCIGVERVLAVKEQQARDIATAPAVQCYVASVGNGMLRERLALCRDLWAAGIPAECNQLANPKMGKQLNYVLEAGIPFMAVIGSNEVEQQVVNVKRVAENVQETVPRAELAGYLTGHGCGVVTQAGVLTFPGASAGPAPAPAPAAAAAVAPAAAVAAPAAAAPPAPARPGLDGPDEFSTVLGFTQQ